MHICIPVLRNVLAPALYSGLLLKRFKRGGSELGQGATLELMVQLGLLQV